MKWIYYTLKHWIEIIWYTLHSRNYGYGYWNNVWCRLFGHGPVWWINVNATEPDMHCQKCGEDLG